MTAQASVVGFLKLIDIYGRKQQSAYIIYNIHTQAISHQYQHIATHRTCCGDSLTVNSPPQLYISLAISCYTNQLSSLTVDTLHYHSLVRAITVKIHKY